MLFIEYVFESKVTVLPVREGRSRRGAAEVSRVSQTADEAQLVLAAPSNPQASGKQASRRACFCSWIAVSLLESGCSSGKASCWDEHGLCCPELANDSCRWRRVGARSVWVRKWVATADVQRGVAKQGPQTRGDFART